jgi:hypothetical protein
MFFTRDFSDLRSFQFLANAFVVVEEEIKLRSIPLQGSKSEDSAKEAEREKGRESSKERKSRRREREKEKETANGKSFEKIDLSKLELESEIDMESEDSPSAGKISDRSTGKISDRGSKRKEKKDRGRGKDADASFVNPVREKEIIRRVDQIRNDYQLFCDTFQLMETLFTDFHAHPVQFPSTLLLFLFLILLHFHLIFSYPI